MPNLRKVLLCVLCVGCMFSSCTCKKINKPPPPNGGKVVKPPNNRDDKKLEVERKRVELNNTQWEIEVKPGGGRGKAYTDVLTFTDRRMESKKFKDQGFGPSNYTLRIDSQGTASWETMQTKEGAVVFWRADRRAGKMRGVISVQPARGKNKSFTFISVSSKKIEPPPG